MFKLGALVCLRSLASNSVKSSIVKAVKHENLISLKVQPVRNGSFFNRYSQKELWKGTVSVSNAGRRKGRGKVASRKGKRNLNSGQKVGEGKNRVLWPGLNTEVLKKTKVVEIKPVSGEKRHVVPSVGVAIKRKKDKNPLTRGWSGATMKGKKLGPPATQDDTFENFESIILELKTLVLPTALLGKKRRYFSIVAIGNGEGVFGFGTAKTIERNSSLNLAKNRATKKLLTLNLIEKHTVNHDFFSQYGCTKVFAFKRPQGHGLICHRIIKAICQLIGIKDLYVKVEGPCVPIHIIRAFVVGLLRQKTYQDIADEKKLHLVEFREESCNFPLLLASPKECLKQSEMDSNPILFEEYIMGDRLMKERERKLPFYTKTPSWRTYLRRTSFKRNHEKVKIDLMVKYGVMRSHLTDIYPECTSPSCVKKKEEKAQEV